MRILLDESLPKALRARLVGHEAATVVSCGWSGIKNGKLLALAAARFDVFLTADQNIEYQQNLSTLPISVFVLVVKNNRIESIEPLVPELLSVLEDHVPRSLRKIGG
jgi:predicted nuclease of predicted toxin-antitoxin system